MDQDQDLLDKLDLREGPRVLFIAALIGGLSLIAGALCFLTLRLQLNSSEELSADGASLVIIAAITGLTLAYRRFR
jgi:hypothetical protein